MLVIVVHRGLEKQKGGFGNQNGGTGGAIPPDALYNPSLKSPIIGSEMDYDNNSAKVSIKNNGHNPARMRSPTDIIYADLQIPRSSNNGSMRIDRPQPPPRTEYAAIQFNPSGVRERADV
ncbi:unnamed protein product [Cyprideis torosa]|uniref:Uncharacterized protein n=1 Tax=Cyprideis torosa TaxID=163714 RepID=A0A7R8ZKM3_9CRUS|nr:unnamed protein product [Cyprideis torosa]CAG0880545.1 unnamed protein product [Cyprideis torosa]